MAQSEKRSARGGGAETRQRIIEAGARLIHSRGYNNTGIKDILDAAGVPKGSFYFYFKNKEDYGLQVVEYFAGFFGSVAREILEECQGSPMERLKAFMARFREFFDKQGASLGCPVGNLAQEMGDLSPAFRERLARAIDGMAAWFEKILAQAVEQGEIDPGLDPRETAYFLVSSWHGALVRMKVVKSVAPLELFERMVFERLLVAPGGARQGRRHRATQG